MLDNVMDKHLGWIKSNKELQWYLRTVSAYITPRSVENVRRIADMLKFNLNPNH